jgi:hypothetical protein
MKRERARGRTHENEEGKDNVDELEDLRRLVIHVPVREFSI